VKKKHISKVTTTEFFFRIVVYAVYKREEVGSWSYNDEVDTNKDEGYSSNGGGLDKI
jgi:hypothetical protein